MTPCAIKSCPRRAGRFFAIVAGVRRPVCDHHGSPTVWAALIKRGAR